MVIVRVCVGSSCYLKGAPEIVDLLEKRIAENKLENEITLVGSFCAGKCNRIGVTVAVNDELITAVTKENFNELWNEKIMSAVNSAKAEG